MKILLSLLLLGSVLFAKNAPLIMKHADSLSVTKRTGILLLKGRVHFVHDSVVFKTSKATWNRNSDIVQCNENFLFTHPSGFIKANTGVYQKRIDFASATGKVIAKDSANSYALFGERLEYDRKLEILTIPVKPLLEGYSKNKDNSVDTVSVRAKKIVYDKKKEFAKAYQDVVVSQKEMTVVCDTGYFDKKNNWLALKGNPKCILENHELSGDSIFLKLTPDGKSLEYAYVIRNAHGIQIEKPKGKAIGTHTEAFGDTLYAEFDGKKLKRLYVNLNAHGFFFEEDLKDYKNLMSGNRLDLDFAEGKISKAIITGNAESTYFYVKQNRSVAGKNLAAGDSIHIEFNPKKNQVKTLKVRGSASPSSGRYIDLEGIAKRNKKDTSKDSLIPFTKEKLLTQGLSHE